MNNAPPSVAMKCFERLVMAHNNIIPDTMDQLQSQYCPNNPQMKQSQMDSTMPSPAWTTGKPVRMLLIG
jgi:hypothetical protein